MGVTCLGGLCSYLQRLVDRGEACLCGLHFYLKRPVGQGVKCLGSLCSYLRGLLARVNYVLKKGILWKQRLHQRTETRVCIFPGPD